MESSTGRQTYARDLDSPCGRMKHGLSIFDIYVQSDASAACAARMARNGDVGWHAIARPLFNLTSLAGKSKPKCAAVLLML